MAPMKSLKDFAIYPDLIRKFIEKGHNVFVFSPLERRNWLNKNNQNFLTKVNHVRTLNLTKTTYFENVHQEIGNLKR